VCFGISQATRLRTFASCHSAAKLLEIAVQVF
jgi:hypothetical protein